MIKILSAGTIKGTCISCDTVHSIEASDFKGKPSIMFKCHYCGFVVKAENPISKQELLLETS